MGFGGGGGSQPQQVRKVEGGQGQQQQQSSLKKRFSFVRGVGSSQGQQGGGMSREGDYIS